MNRRLTDHQNVTYDDRRRPSDKQWLVRSYANSMQELIESAAEDGVVLTIELEPVGHEMGSYVMRGHVRGAR